MAKQRGKGGTARGRTRQPDPHGQQDPPLPEPEWVDEILPRHLERGLLSIIVFGPGVGESVVVCLPNGSVGVVDGCREPASTGANGDGDPVRELLRHLQVETLRFVCLTHPHDDHYRGLGRLLDAYGERVEEVWCPLETGDRYAATLVKYIACQRAGQGLIPDDDPKALDRAFRAMQPRRGASIPRPRLVLENTELLRQTMNNGFLTIRGIGPSATDLKMANVALVKAIKESSGTHDPNDASGALLIRWHKAQVLLAGDLTRGAGPLRGWNGVEAQITGRVQVVNVAHHASAGAHHDDLWTRMKPRLAIVTPFKNASGANPPRPADIARLIDSKARVVITARPSWSWDDPAVQLPQPRRGPPDVSESPRAPKNGVLSKDAAQTPASPFNARRNAVAVSLDRHGTIRRVILSGQADFYSR